MRDEARRIEIDLAFVEKDVDSIQQTIAAGRHGNRDPVRVSTDFAEL